MKRTSISAFAAALVLVALTVSAAPGQIMTVRAAPGAAASPAAADGPKPIPLVNADEEMASFVNRAREMVARKDYHAAIEILQALLNRAEQCFVPVGDGRRFISLAANASAEIGKLPPAGMKLYRRMYDPEADELLRRAGENPDEAYLRGIVRRYLHTAHGDEALNMLGALLFDRGRFSQAARCWRDVLTGYHDSDLDAAALLVKIAVAHHFAGETRRAAEAMATLRQKHAKADCVLAGKKQNAVAFAASILSRERPSFGGVRAATRGWASMAGAPEGMAVMAPCRPVLSPRWTMPRGSLKSNPNLRALAALSQNTNARFRHVVNGRVVTGAASPPSMELREGHVVFAYKTGNRTQRVVLPAIMHPVVVDTTVIVRQPHAIVAYDLLTGEKMWDTFDDFPLYRKPKAISGSQRFYGGNMPLPSIEDQGRCALTVGGGKVFAVGRFRPLNTRRYYNPRGQTVQDPDNSVLAAFSLLGQGKLIWRSDDTRRPEIVQGGKFVSPPTYVNGRLYVVAEYMQTYYLFCLDADTGKMIWPAPAMVSQTPAAPARNFNPYNMNTGLDRGSAPAVADGRVFVCTNAGVVAAFEAETGQALWAYQYESALNRPGRSSRSSRTTTQVKTYPPNPVIVAHGRVICLPSDGEKALALRADSGEPAWGRGLDRRKQRYLTAIDENRILLSGPALKVIDAGTGSEAWPGGRSAKTSSEIRGRPAVTSEAVLASGEGEVVILWLKDYSVTTPPLATPNAILGNLVCVDGKLLAANAAGVSAYFTFEDAHQELTARMDKAARKELASLLHQRAMNAFNAGRPTQALTDLLQAKKLADETSQATLIDRIRQSLYRTYVALGNKASDPATMHGYLRQAEAQTYSERSKAEMLLRMAKYNTRIGKHAEAARMAHELTVGYRQTDMVDVEIGAAADPYVRDDADTPRFSGYALGQKFLAQLISKQGQSCYAAFDVKAGTALDAAVAADGPDDMIDIARVYKHSTHAPLALLRAGESLYRRALKAPKAVRIQLLSDAGRNLSRIDQEYPKSGLGPSAALGLAMVYREMNPRIIWLGLKGVSGIPGETRVAFAGVSGTLTEALKQFDSSLRSPRSGPTALNVSIQPPLVKLQSVAGAALVLRRPNGLPVRLGKHLFILKGAKLVMLDPTAGSFSAGTSWEAPLPMDTNRMFRYGFSSWSMAMVGGVSTDKSAVVVACRGGFYGVDIRTGKILWRKTASDSMITRLNWMAVGDDRLVVLDSSGKISALDIRSGKLVFTHNIPSNQTPWRGEPQVRGGMLLTIHGRTKWMATVFDLGRKRALGSIGLGSSRSQAHLTADGLVIANDGASLRLVEPVLGMQQDIWKVALAGASQPAILGATDTHAILSPSYQSGLIELRSLADYGRIQRSFSTRRIGGDTAVPIWARVVDKQLYVVAGTATGTNRSAIFSGRLSYARSPSLQVFDTTTGKLQWSANLSMQGPNLNLYVMPVEVCRTHVTTLVKQSYNIPSYGLVLDRRTGRLVQKIEIPGVQPQRGVRAMHHMRHYWIGSPALAQGRMLLETHKAFQVYGTKKAEANP